MTLNKQQFLDVVNAATLDGDLSGDAVNYLINYLVSNGNLVGSPRDMIQVRRGNKIDLPRLGQGELALTLDSNELFIGGMNGNVKVGKQQIDPVLFGAIPNMSGLDIAEMNSLAFNECIKFVSENGGGSITIPEGTYELGSYIRLRKNVTLRGYGVTLKPVTSNNKVFINGEKGNATYATGYNGDGNIHIYGLTIDMNCGTGRLVPSMTCSAFDMGHGYNLSWNDVTIKNAQIGHFFQITGCKKVLFNNCKFGDMIFSDMTTTIYECIQIEAMSAEAFPTFGGWDLTPTVDVTINNVDFDGVVRAFGTHSDGMYGTPSYIYAEDVKVNNVRIKNTYDAGVYLTAFKDIQMSNVTIENVGGTGLAFRGLNGFTFTNIKFKNIKRAAMSGTDLSNGSMMNVTLDGYAMHETTPYAGLRATNVSDVIFNTITGKNNGVNNSSGILIDGVLSNNKAVNINMPKGTSDAIRGITSLTWCTVGDSITNGGDTYGYWQDEARKYLPQVNLHYRRGYGGYTVSISATAAYSSIHEKFVDGSIPVSDSYTVMLGTNDFSRNVPVGTSADATGKTDSFWGGLKQLYIDLTDKNMLATIVIVTPLKRVTSSGLAWDVANTAGFKLEDYVNALKDWAKQYSLPVIDMFSESGISNRSASQYLYDGLHPNVIGNQHIGTIIGKRMAALI